MVARITMPGSIKKALNYNEQKVHQGKARCLHAANFVKDAGQMNFHEKIQRFENLIELNQRAKTNSLHISLNFSPGEKIVDHILTEIANTYMDKIGFGEQPFLVYKHTDAGHPHIHIVSTNIKADGKRISLHNLGKEKSAVARKEIEIQFGLIKAEQSSKQVNTLQNIQAQKIQYGKDATKQQLSNAVSTVTRQYKYATLPELNAVLKLYNVVADRGAEDGIMYKRKGLRYAVLDSSGKKTGVPIKASLLAGKPTLQYLEAKFEQNKPLKQVFKKSTRTRVDWVLNKNISSIESFRKELEKENIILQIRQNESGRIYGLTYIDLNSKTVFNGNEIGKPYAANAILEKLGLEQTSKQLVINIQHSIPGKLPVPFKADTSLQNSLFDLISNLLENNPDYTNTPYQFRKKDKKKRKR